jgi:hypothetical protein
MLSVVILLTLPFLVLAAQPLREQDLFITSDLDLLFARQVARPHIVAKDHQVSASEADRKTARLGLLEAVDVCASVKLLVTA